MTSSRPLLLVHFYTSEQVALVIQLQYVKNRYGQPVLIIQEIKLEQ
jgi:hypothetical protein